MNFFYNPFFIYADFVIRRSRHKYVLTRELTYICVFDGHYPQVYNEIVDMNERIL